MDKRYRIFRILGCLLILAGMGVLLFTQCRANIAREKAGEITAQIRSILPRGSAGVAEDYSCTQMPVLQVGGKDFSALVEVPAFGVTLPVYDTWEADKVSLFPCRFSGTVYEGSLIIGGADQQGQFDFLDRIEVGSVVTIVDMTGAAFTYRVSRVDRSKTAVTDVLSEEGTDLTLFARDNYSLEYLIVRCVAGT